MALGADVDAGGIEVDLTERAWLREHRPEAARHWKLLTDWRADTLRYGG